MSDTIATIEPTTADVDSVTPADAEQVEQQPAEPVEPAEQTDRTYTREQLNQQIATAIKRELKRYNDLRQQNDKLIAQLNADLATVHTAPPPSIEDRLELLELEHQRRVAELREQLEQERAAASEATSATVNYVRRSAIREALTAAGCLDIPTAERFFDEQIENDGDGYKFRNQEGELVQLVDGFKAELPDYLLAANLRGGSGTTGVAPKQKGAYIEIAQAEKQLERLRRDCIANRCPSGMMTAYRRELERVRLMKERYKKGER